VGVHTPRSLSSKPGRRGEWDAAFSANRAPEGPPSTISLLGGRLGSTVERESRLLSG